MEISSPVKFYKIVFRGMKLNFVQSRDNTTKAISVSRCQALHIRLFYRFLSALQQNRAQSRLLFCFMIKNPIIFHTRTISDISGANATSLKPDTAVGLRPDSSKHKLQFNFCCLNAKYYIWLCRQKKYSPKLNDFLLYLKQIYEMEKKYNYNLFKKVGASVSSIVIGS